MKRRRTSRRPKRRSRRNFSATATLRDIDHLLTKAEDELENSRVLPALAAYMMARDLACTLTGTEFSPVLAREWAAISK